MAEAISPWARPSFRFPSETRSTLAFPGKVASDGAGRLAIADTGNDRVLVCDLDGGVQNEFGGFHQPQGVRFNA